MVKNKIILIFIGVYLFVLSVLPLIIPSMIGLICSSISERSSYEIEVTEPKFYFSIMPVGTFKAKEINIKSKMYGRKIIANHFPLILPVS